MSVLTEGFANVLSKVRSDVLIPQACVVCLPRWVRTAEEPCLLCFPQVLADAVSHLVVDKFSELTDNFTSPHARRKVLAGVVMTTGDFVGLFLEFLLDVLAESKKSYCYVFLPFLQHCRFLLLDHDYTLKHLFAVKLLFCIYFPNYFAWLISKVNNNRYIRIRGFWICCCMCTL